MIPNQSCYYLLAAKHSGKFLTIIDNGDVVQEEIFDLNKQMWKFIPVQGNSFNLVLVGNERCLQKRINTQPELEISAITGNCNQKWEVIPAENGEYFYIRNENDGEFKYLNISGALKGSGAAAIVWKESGNKYDNQKWKLLPIPVSQPSTFINSNPITITEDHKNSLMKLEKNLLESFKNLIFQGPPGTSKTYNAKLLAASVVLGEDDIAKLEPIIREEGDLEQNEFPKARFPGEGPKGSWSIVQFHPAYNYEDFVRGIEVRGEGSNVSYNAVRRIFDRMAHAAWKTYRKAIEEGKDIQSCPKFVLIIDEINRAHLAAVLGELIYALEYRGSPVDSPYAVQNTGEDGKELAPSTQIVVPPNLYIIGTMNTADRSIGHIDYAVRRRFAFVPLLPDPTPINSKQGKKLFGEIAKLFRVNSDQNGCREKTLSLEFHADDVQPGHTYFITRSSEVLEELAGKFAYQVYPLLREYFKDGILINAPKLFDGKLGLDTPMPPEKVRELVKSFLE